MEVLIEYLGSVDQVSFSQSARRLSPNPNISSRGHANHNNIYKKHTICEKDHARHFLKVAAFK